MILFGKPVAEKIYAQIKTDLKEMKNLSKLLAVILVGEDPASLLYVKIKEKKAQELGINFKLYHLPGIATEAQLESLIRDLNQNDYVGGIVLQLPLPSDFDSEKILNKISPEKDIDGFQKHYAPPAAQAILEILKFYHIDYQKKKIAIIGRGRLVGEPLEYLLKKEKITPTICDSETPDLKEKILNAELVVSATGTPNLITNDMVNSNSIIIDAGTSESGGKMVGDVLPKVYEKVKDYSPVPGGVGPVTVACLFHNYLKSVKNENNRS